MTTILFYTAAAIIGSAVALVAVVVIVGLLAYILEAKGFITNGPTTEPAATNEAGSL